MNSIMYFATNFVYFNRVLSHLIMKIKNFMKCFKEGVLNISQFSRNFQIFQSEIFHRASLPISRAVR